MNLIHEKQNVVSGDEVTLRSLWAFCFCSISLCRRDCLQKSIDLNTSYDSDSNLVHLFDFPLFVMLVDLVKKKKNNRGLTSKKSIIICVCVAFVPQE